MAITTKVREFNLTDAQFDEVRALVRQTAGISLGDGKRDLVRSRLNKRLRSLGVESYDEYLAMVRGDKSGQEIIHLLDAISTNVTNFFREPAHFDYLGEILREREAAAAQGRGPRSIRIWSAGCSSGEEPYTIAMTVLESISSLKGWDVKILATDISTNVLDKAGRGVYPAEAGAKMPRGVLGKYFERSDDGQIAVNRQVRGLVTFGRLNLMGPWPMKGPFDAIFCRNVMIYFEKATQMELVGRYHGMLAQNGILFIGHSENLTGHAHGFKSVRPTVYRKVG
ncbi:MAG TPA: protein-glutamate O-methyltransferase CheR [Candidatus Krumholzibacteria bacterium]|nr:protein-glutamate O-methyltransferase CheR [Candidatus Krumholzibacteria bacterium]